MAQSVKFEDWGCRLQWQVGGWKMRECMGEGGGGEGIGSEWRPQGKDKVIRDMVRGRG